MKNKIQALPRYPYEYRVVFHKGGFEILYNDFEDINDVVSYILWIADSRQMEKGLSCTVFDRVGVDYYKQAFAYMAANRRLRLGSVQRLYRRFQHVSKEMRAALSIPVSREVRGELSIPVNLALPDNLPLKKET